jgi:AraC-like DNA-binding protein
MQERFGCILGGMLVLTPPPALQPFVRQLWISDTTARPAIAREHVLPTGQMHLVFRLAGPPLRLFDGAQDLSGSVIGEPVVGGARAAYYVKESGAAVTSLGVQLLPGAALSLFGASAAELAERHTPLSELWGAQGRSALDQIAEATGPQARLDVLAAMLRLRLPRIQAMHPAVAALLSGPGQLARIDALVRDSSYSHRRFIALFREATGMSPKRYARLMRFRALLAALRAAPASPLGMLALEAGYSDQAHMNREFRAFAGLTPVQYLRLAPADANHVVLA